MSYGGVVFEEEMGSVQEQFACASREARTGVTAKPPTMSFVALPGVTGTPLTSRRRCHSPRWRRVCTYANAADGADGGARLAGHQNQLPPPPPPPPPPPQRQEEEEVEEGLDAQTRSSVLVTGSTNALRNIPNILPPEEHLARATKLAERSSLDARTKRGKSFAEVHRFHQMERVETLRQELAGRMQGYLDQFPPKQRLHPYEDALIELTLTGVKLDKHGCYEGILNDTLKLKKKLNEQGKVLTRSIRVASNRKEVDRAKERAFEELTNMYRKDAPVIERLKLMAKTLYRTQIANVKLPTIILAGAPNVGKSSLVRAYSSGIPEVCAYPFTTKTIIMGHFVEDGQMYQMTDTPGLMNRAESSRNLIEKLTIAALEHLRSVVIFVVDLTEDCGTSVEDQLELRDVLRGRFLRPDQPWVDVLSKTDVEESFKKEHLYRDAIRDDFLRVSVETEVGLAELKGRFMAALASIPAEGRAEPTEDGSEDGWS